jgi:hypothetical protein
LKVKHQNRLYTIDFDSFLPSFQDPGTLLIAFITLNGCTDRISSVQSRMLFFNIFSCLVIFVGIVVVISDDQETLRSVSTEGIKGDAMEWGSEYKSAKLNMTLCTGRCNGDCVSYTTPLSTCYSPSSMYPDDPSWSEFDIWDMIQFDPKLGKALRRMIFPSQDGTCHDAEDPSDVFLIPLDECVGPFGQPRPWGVFDIIYGPDDKVTDDSIYSVD